MYPSYISSLTIKNPTVDPPFRPKEFFCDYPYECGKTTGGSTDRPTFGEKENLRSSLIVSALRSVTVAGGAVEAPGARPEYGRAPAYHGRGTRDARGSGDQVRSRHLCGKVPSTTREHSSAYRAQKSCRCTGAHTRSHALYICSYGGGSVHGDVWG